MSQGLCWMLGFPVLTQIHGKEARTESATECQACGSAAKDVMYAVWRGEGCNF